VSQLPDIEKRIAEAVSAYEEAVAPILRDLERVDIDVKTVGQLKHQALRQRVAAAAPILVHWLPQVRYVPLKLDIVSVLGLLPDSPLVANALVEEFAKPEEEQVRWSIGSAIEGIANDSMFADVARLVRRTDFGRDRQMLALALGKMNRERALPVLLELLDDDDIVGHAASALRKLHPPEARAKLETLIDHPRAWVRREVRKAIAAIDKESDLNHADEMRSDAP
jgi:HEAT repeat protein